MQKRKNKLKPVAKKKLKDSSQTPTLKIISCKQVNMSRKIQLAPDHVRRSWDNAYLKQDFFDSADSSRLPFGISVEPSDNRVIAIVDTHPSKMISLSTTSLARTFEQP